MRAIPYVPMGVPSRKATQQLAARPHEFAEISRNAAVTEGNSAEASEPFTPGTGYPYV